MSEPEKSGKLSLAAVNEMPPARIPQVFHGIFEHSPWVMERVAGLRPFADRLALDTALTRVLAEASGAEKHALLAAHPVLGGAAARQGALTAESKSEQSGLGLDRMAGEEERTFADLNQAYLERFGFPFVIAVRGQRDRAAILRALMGRLGETPAAELETALAEVRKIAGFRLDSLLEPAEAPGARPLSLSLHVLDTMRGGAGEGLAFTLRCLSAGGEEFRRSGVTDREGRWRLDAPLFAGLFEITFEAGAYQARFGAAGFYDTIPVRFRIAADGGHYHVPLILSPFGYSTYRGG